MAHAFDWPDIAELLSDGLIETDDAGLVRWSNGAAAHLFGWPAGGLVGRPLGALLTRVDEPDHVLPTATAESFGLNIETGNRLGHRADGSTFPAEIRVVDNAHGRAYVVRPLVARSDLDLELQRLFEVANELMCVAGLDGTFKRVNPAFERALGHTTEALLSRPFIDFVHPDDREATFAAVGRLRGRQDVVDFENRYLDDQGNYHPLSWRAVAEPERGLIFATARDVTELHRAHALARSKAAALERANTDLKHFVYAASHDLRTPVRGARNVARWMLEDHGDALPAGARRQVDQLAGALDRLGRMLNDLHTFARAGRTKHRPIYIDTNQQLSTWIAEMVAPPPGVRIEIEPLPGVEAPETLLAQVFANLIRNAIKHHDRGDGLITISGEVEGESAVYRVADDGPGVPEEFAERIFRVFATLKRRDDVEGSGLGLALARRIVHAAGGEIHLVPTEGRGATFEFTWPLVWSD